MLSTQNEFRDPKNPQQSIPLLAVAEKCCTYLSDLVQNVRFRNRFLI